MVIDFIKGNGGGGGGTDPQMRASGFTGVELSGTTLEFSNLSGTEVGSVDLSGIGGASDVLEPKTSIPESGDAGTLIAVNKPDEYGWKAYSGYNAEKSRTQISYYAEPGENPNPDLSQYPTRYQISLQIADSVDASGNYNYGIYDTIEFNVDYQGNITFTNTGSFVQDGDVYSYTSSIYNTDTGEYENKTIVMSYGDGFLYFNLESGDCPYYINTAYQYYWADQGYWDYDPETGEPTTWNESWNEMQNTPNYQEWGIANPAKIGIYQANSANTYVEFDTKNADRAGFTTLIKAYEDNGGDFHNNHFNAGDLIVPSSSDYRPRVKTGDGDGFDGDFESLAYVNEVNELANRLNNLKIEEVYAKEDTPVYVDNGNLIAVHNSGETVVKQAYAESGFTYVPMGWGDTGYYGIKQSDGQSIGLYVEVGDGTNKVWVGLFFDGSSWDFSDLSNWTVNQTDTLTWDATDNFGYGWTLNAYNDGSYNYVEFSQPVVEFYGGGAEEKRVPQTAYQTAVMSKQGVCQIWKGSQNDYDAITTKDSSTVYIII